MNHWPRLKLTLLARFSLVAFVLTAAIAIVLAWGLQRQLEQSALRQEAEDAAYQVATILNPNLEVSDLAGPIDSVRYARIDALIRQYILGQHNIRVKIWGRDGLLLYSDAQELVGRRFPVSEELESALSGKMAMEVSSLTKEENVAEQGRYDRLFEVYAPLRPMGSPEVVGAYEIYHDLAVLEPGLAKMRRFVWAGVGLSFLILYGSLFTLVRNASRELVRRSEESARLYEETQQRLAERERAEVRLRVSEARFRGLFESAPDAVVIVNADGHIAFVNAQVEKMFGYRPDELLGQPIEALLPERFRERHAEHRMRFASAPQARSMGTGLELYGRRKDGSEFFTDIALGPLEADGELVVLSLVRDITERKRSEQEIERRAAELEVLAQVSSALRDARTAEDMLPIFLRQATRVVGAAQGAIFLVEPGSGDLVARAFHPPDPSLLGLRHHPGEGITGHVAATGQIHISADLQRDPLVHILPAEAERLSTIRSMITLPLRTRERPVGVMHLGLAEQRTFADEEVRLLTAIGDIAANALHRAGLHEQTERGLERLAALHAIDRAISASLDLHVTLNVLLDQVTAQLRADAAGVLLLNPHTQMLEQVAGRGFRTQAMTHSRLRLGEGLAGQAALERRIIEIPNAAESGAIPASAGGPAGEAFSAQCFVPLVAKGQIKGVLEIFHRTAPTPDPEVSEFLEAIATQAAIAIDNVALFESLQRSNLDLALAYDTTLEGWSRALDLRDRETEGHTQRVTEMTERLARAIGTFSEAELTHVRRGALLHDMGKMGIPDNILLKPGPLTNEEWVIMRKHPEYAYQMLSPIAYLRPALDIPYCHHEKWDGTGYPRGLKGEAIPLAARAFAVVDVYDALRSERPYRKGWPEEKVREYLHASSGTHFDPQAVEAFLRLE